ncbi:hypothetical protein [Tenacibaculum sp. 190524A02b]|uniref:hypothetical protein n=1 Tax=Tenacibaculum vairaonense TaxID=3137860 RepID=UPI0032B30967
MISIISSKFKANNGKPSRNQIINLKSILVDSDSLLSLSRNIFLSFFMLRRNEMLIIHNEIPNNR